LIHQQAVCILQYFPWQFRVFQQLVVNIPFGLYYHFLASNENLETSKENVEANRKVAGYQKRPLLADIRGTAFQSKESRDYYSSNELDNYFSAMALIINDSFSKVIGNFYIGINIKLKTPTRLFVSEGEAIEWLRTFK